MPIFPSGAVQENRQDRGGFQVRDRPRASRSGLRTSRATALAQDAGLACRDRRTRPPRGAERGLEGDACRFRPLYKPEGLTGTGADRIDGNGEGSGTGWSTPPAFAADGPRICRACPLHACPTCLSTRVLASRSAPAIAARVPAMMMTMTMTRCRRMAGGIRECRGRSGEERSP